MKKNQDLVSQIGMQFDEATELFGAETLESMAMAHVVGGATNNGCTQKGACLNDNDTNNGCTQDNCSQATGSGTSTPSTSTTPDTSGGTNSGNSGNNTGTTVGHGNGSTVQISITGCRK